MDDFGKWFYGRIVKDKAVLDDPEGWSRLKHSLNEQDIQIRLEPRDRHSDTDALRRYYRSFCRKFAAYNGDTPEDVHKEFARRFLREHPDDETSRVRSTTELSRDEWITFIERCAQLASEMGFTVERYT